MSEHRAMQLSRLAQRHDGTALATVRQLARCPMLPSRLGGDVFAVPPRYLVALRKRGEGVRYRHLAGLVALEPHLFEDLAAGEAAAFADHFHQFVAFGAAPGAGRAASPSLCLRRAL